ncbi:hypothetical protein Taro_025010 [Colocasia esculenta]|uniref:Uncharacterized protein n=1 Tax=Colocasia esculenta TaxID=4460 RepID=A0A843VM35_COLES|nr:hypothetical protein [Colocasia esculenta]
MTEEGQMACLRDEGCSGCTHRAGACCTYRDEPLSLTQQQDTEKEVRPESIEVGEIIAGQEELTMMEEPCAREAIKDTVGKGQGDKLWDEQRDTVPPAIEVQTPANPHEIIEEKLKHAEVEPPYGDDAGMGTESVEADLFSPLFLPEEHQPEEMTSALMPGVELPLNINDNVGRHVKPMEPEPIVSVHSRGELLPNINDNIGMHAKPVEPEPIEPVQSRGEQPPFINDKIGRQAKPLEPELIESVQSRVELPTNVNDNIVSQAKPVEPEPIESVQSRGELPPNINDYIGSHVKPVKQELTKSVQSRGELPPIINDNIERHDKPLEPEPMDSVQSRGELPTNVSDNIVSHAKPVEPEPIESVQSRGELLPNINDNIASHAQLVEPEPIESVQSRGELHPNINDNIGSHVKPVDPEPKESIQSTPDQASLFKEIKIEAPEKLHDPESGRKETTLAVCADALVHGRQEDACGLIVEECGLGTMGIDGHTGDDSYEGNETVEVDLSSSPLLSEKHQSEEIPDASTLGSELPTNINDTIGKNVEPAEPESVTSVQSTPNQANLLEEIKIEIAGNSDASGSVALDQTIPTPEEVITTEEVCTERSPESDSSILTTVATGATQDDETMVYIGVQTDAPTNSGKRRQWEWNILKAIVYGGLLESIASLSVVSAAASSDVATLTGDPPQVPIHILVMNALTANIQVVFDSPAFCQAWFCTAERIGSIRPHRSESTPARKCDPPGSADRQGIDRIRLAPARFARPDPLRFAPPPLTLLPVTGHKLIVVYGILLLLETSTLMELKNKQQESLDGKEQVDLYVELLGRREHFYRHATIALLSYVLFGALPPVIYGFSFWQSDKKALKLIVVAAASLLCITLLALGKAHVQEQKAYGKTLLYYLGIGVGASGVSYAFGILIKQLLESLGLFDDGADVSASPISSILDVMSANLSWASS